MQTLPLFILCLLVMTRLTSAVTVSPEAWERLPPHPRLLAVAAQWDALPEQVKTDQVSKRLYAGVLARADQALDQPVVVYQKEGRRLLGPVREAQGRIIALAMAARISGDARYARRAIAEMREAAGLPDWNPSHFLDTAEMTLGLAIGYDWLYDRLTSDERHLIESAIHDKGLRMSFDAPADQLGWVHGDNNWTQVCHGSLAAGAIATASLDPELAKKVVQRALDNLPPAAKAYAPDGAFPEGPNYWDYGTSFQVILADVLKSGLGSTFGVDAFPGFLASSDYIAEVTAPTGGFWNYADSREVRGFQVAMFWFARERGKADIASDDIKLIDPMSANIKAGPRTDDMRLFPLALLWWDPALAGKQPATAAAAHLPLNWLGGGENPIAIHRSAWDDPGAVFFGIKGGTPGSSHAHMDAGSFILESDGVRWAVDPGMQEYITLESRGVNIWGMRQDSERWRVFRLGPEGHNILRFNNGPELVSGLAKIIAFKPDGDSPHTIVDLTPLYAGSVASARRGVSLRHDRRALIQDEWTAGDQPVEVAWQWLTRAETIVEPHAVTLKQSGQTLHLAMLEPADATLDVEDVSHPQPDYNAVNPDLRRIVLHTHTPARSSGRILVLAEPGSASARAVGGATPAKPLDEWK